MARCLKASIDTALIGSFILLNCLSFIMYRYFHFSELSEIDLSHQFVELIELFLHLFSKTGLLYLFKTIFFPFCYHLVDVFAKILKFIKDLQK